VDERTTETRARVLYLAFDACDEKTMRRLAHEGRCPNLAGLLAEAAIVDTRAPYGTFVGSIWKTFTTALEVGRHRYYNWIRVAEGSYDLRLTSPRETQGTPFWETLSADGFRIAALDLPHADVPTDFGGVLIKEWGAHDRHHGTGSVPAGLRAEVEGAAGGDHPFGTMAHPRGDEQFAPCDYVHRDHGAERTIDEMRRLKHDVLDGLEKKRRASIHLLEQGGWDLFLDVVGETHCVGHQLWHLHDPRHPRFDPWARELLGDPVLEVYEKADEIIGQMLHLAGPEALCFIHFSHGMQAHHDGDHLLDAALDRIERHDRGEQVTTGRSRHASKLARWPRAVDAAARWVRWRTDRAPVGRTPAPGPRADRRWFQIPNNTVVGAIRFNLVGREPEGVVSPDELPRLRQLITTELLQLIDLDSGARVVRRVVPSEDVLDRSPDDHFPDLFVEWERSSQMERIWSPQLGVIAAPYEHWRTGDHNDEGLLLVHGQGVAGGHRAHPMSMTELGPTLAAALGTELRDVDGRPRLDLLPGAQAPQVRDVELAAALPPDPLPGRPELRTVVRLASSAAERADAALAALPANLDAELAELRRVTEQARRAHQVWTTTAWLAGVEVDEKDLVSVITPTYQRPHLLARAIASVQAQTYQRWEMVVVDDGSQTAAPVVEAASDPRVRLIEADHLGPTAARNRGLDAAEGSIVAYLDDDNTFDPGWLKAVAWAFQVHPASDVLYGARLIDDDLRVHGTGDGGWPMLHFEPFDFSALEAGNLADMGTIAHRAGLPEARFDERLWEYGDWDLLLGLTEHRTPLELPAIALRYHTTGTRLSGAHAGDDAVVREKWSARGDARRAAQLAENLGRPAPDGSTGG
jgi:predicted AlkP superfamily phosphohydrolase/phosphomutase